MGRVARVVLILSALAAQLLQSSQTVEPSELVKAEDGQPPTEFAQETSTELPVSLGQASPAPASTTTDYASTTSAFDALISDGNPFNESSILLATTTNEPSSSSSAIDYDSQSYNWQPDESRPVESEASDESSSFKPIDGGSSSSLYGLQDHRGLEQSASTEEANRLEDMADLLPGAPGGGDSKDLSANRVRNRKASEKQPARREMSLLDSILQFSKETLFADEPAKPANSSSSSSSRSQTPLRDDSKSSNLPDYDDFDLDYQLKAASNAAGADQVNVSQDGEQQQRLAGKREQTVRALPQAEPPSWSALIREASVFRASNKTAAGSQSLAKISSPTTALTDQSSARPILPSILTVKSAQLTSQELDRIKPQLMLHEDDGFELGSSGQVGPNSAIHEQEQAYHANGDLWATASNLMAQNRSGPMISLINGSPSLRQRQESNYSASPSSLSTFHEHNNSTVTTIVVDSAQPTELPYASSTSTTAPALLPVASAAPPTSNATSFAGPQNGGAATSANSSHSNHWFNYPNPSIHHNPLLLHHILNKPSLYNKHVLGDTSSSAGQVSAELTSPSSSAAEPTTTTTTTTTMASVEPATSFDSTMAAHILERPAFGVYESGKKFANHMNRTQLQMQFEEMLSIAAAKLAADQHRQQQHQVSKLQTHDPIQRPPPPLDHHHNLNHHHNHHHHHHQQQQQQQQQQQILPGISSAKSTSHQTKPHAYGQEQMSLANSDGGQVQSASSRPVGLGVANNLRLPTNLASQPLLMLDAQRELISAAQMSHPSAGPNVDQPRGRQAQSIKMMASPSLIQEVYTPHLAAGLFSNPNSIGQHQDHTKPSGLSEEDMSTYVAHLAALSSSAPTFRDAPAPLNRPMNASLSVSASPSSSDVIVSQADRVQKELETESGRQQVKLIDLPEDIQTQIYRNYLGTMMSQAHKQDKLATNSPGPSLRIANPPYSKLDSVRGQPMIDSGSNPLRAFASLSSNISNTGLMSGTDVQHPSLSLHQQMNHLQLQQQQQQQQQQQRLKQLAFIEALRDSVSRLQNSKLLHQPPIPINSEPMMQSSSGVHRLRSHSSHSDGRFLSLVEPSSNSTPKQVALGSGPTMSVDDFDEIGSSGSSSNQQPAIPAWLERQILQESIVHETPRVLPSGGSGSGSGAYLGKQPATIATNSTVRPHLASVIRPQPIVVRPLNVAPNQFRPAKTLYPIQVTPLRALHHQQTIRARPHQVTSPANLLGAASQPAAALQAPPAPQLIGFDRDPTRLLANRFPLASAPAYLVKLPTPTGGTITATGTLTPPPARFLLRHPVTGPIRLLAHSLAPGPAPIPPIPILASPGPLYSSPRPLPPSRLRLLPVASSPATIHQPLPSHYSTAYLGPLPSSIPVGHHQATSMQPAYQDYNLQPMKQQASSLASASTELTLNSSLVQQQAADQNSIEQQHQQVNLNYPLTRLQQATASLIELTSLASLAEEIASQTGDIDSSPAMALVNALSSLQQQGSRQVPINAQASTSTDQQQQQQRQQQQQQQQQFSWRNLINQAIWRDKTYNKLRELERLIAGAAARRPLVGSPQPQARLKVKYIRVPVAVYEPVGGTNGADQSSAILVPNERELMTKTQLAELVATKDQTGKPSMGSLSDATSNEVPTSAGPNQSSHGGGQQPFVVSQSISSGQSVGSNQATRPQQLSLPLAAGSSSAASSSDYLFDEISSDSMPQLAFSLQADPKSKCAHNNDDITRYNGLSSTSGSTVKQPEGLSSLETALYYSLLSSPPPPPPLMPTAPATVSSLPMREPVAAASEKRAKKARGKKKGKKGKKGESDDDLLVDDNDDDDDADEQEDDSVLSKDDLPLIESIISTIVHGAPTAYLPGQAAPPDYLPVGALPAAHYLGAPHHGLASVPSGSRLPWRSRGGLRAEASGNVASYAHPAAGGAGASLGSFGLRHRLTLGEVLGAIGAKRLISSLFSGKKDRVRPGKRALANGRKYKQQKGAKLEDRAASTTSTSTTTTTSTTSTTTSLPPTLKRKQPVGSGHKIFNLNRPSVIKDLKGASNDSLSVSADGVGKKQQQQPPRKPLDSQVSFDQVRYNFYLQEHKKSPSEKGDNKNWTGQDPLADGQEKQAAMPLYHIVADHYSKFHHGSTTQLAHQVQQPASLQGNQQPPPPSQLVKGFKRPPLAGAEVKKADT